MIASGVLAVICFVLALLSGGGLLGAVGLSFAAGFGLPRWILSFLKKRREKNFLKALPAVFSDLSPIKPAPSSSEPPSQLSIRKETPPEL